MDAAMVPSDYPEQIECFHITPRRLGEGSFCKVFAATHEETGEKVAAKMVNKAHLRDDIDRAHVTRGVQMLQSLQHPNICRVAWISETAAKVCVFLEHAEDGSMLDVLRTRGRLCEDDARVYLAQLVEGLAYCHRRGVVHRNVKLQNVLVAHGGVVKLSSFGYANEFSRRQLLATIQESPHFVAPEVILAMGMEDSAKVDVWSAGIVLFAMLSGRLPFIHGHMKTLCKLILTQPFVAPDGLSDDCLDLLQRMLDKRPSHRPSMEEVLAHPWLVGTPTPAHSLPCDAEIDDAIAHEMEEHGFPAVPGQTRPNRAKAALTRLLLSIRYCRERNQTHEVPESTGVTSTTRSPDSSFTEDDDDDDFAVPTYVPPPRGSTTTMAGPATLLSPATPRDNAPFTPALLDGVARRKRHTTECEDELPSDVISVPASPTRPSTPPAVKRSRVTPPPPDSATPSVDCW